MLIVGGSNGCIRVIDTDRMEVIGEVFQTAIGRIMSMQICKVEKMEVKKYYLNVTGARPDYSEGKTDVFELTNLFNIYPYIQIANEYQIPINKALEIIPILRELK